MIGLRIPTGRRQTSWLFTSMVEDLNSGLPRTNPASSQSGPLKCIMDERTIDVPSLQYILTCLTVGLNISIQKHHWQLLLVHL